MKCDCFSTVPHILLLMCLITEGENIKTNELLEGFARINRDEHQRKLQERLNKRRQRLANGMKFFITLY